MLMAVVVLMLMMIKISMAKNDS